MCIRTGIEHVYWGARGRHGRAKRVPCHWCRLKCKFDNLNKTLVAKQRLDMCARTGIKNVYWGDQGLAPDKAWPREASAVVQVQV